MSVWKSIFLHEFLDDDLLNFIATDGTLITSPFLPVMTRHGNQPSTFAAQIMHDKWFRFELAEPFEKVIGIDVTFSISIPINNISIGPGAQQLISIGQLFYIRVIKGPNNPGHTSSPAWLQVISEVGQSPGTFAPFIYEKEKFSNLRINWRTSGQLRIWYNGKLVAFYNNFAAQQKFNIGHIVIGHPEDNVISTDYVEMSHIYLKLLREDDALRRVAKEFPVQYCEDPRLERCTKMLQAKQLEIMDLFRSFMSKFIRKTTAASWQADNEGPESPFTKEANIAHEVATKSFLSFLKFLKEPSDINRKHFLNLIGQFFNILFTTAPDEYAAFLKKLEQYQYVDAECRKYAGQIFDQNRAKLEPIQQLIIEMYQLIKDVSKPNEYGKS